MEEDQIQQHQHDDNGHDHGAESTSEADEHYHWFSDYYFDVSLTLDYDCTDDDKYNFVYGGKNWCLGNAQKSSSTGTSTVRVTTKTQVYNNLSNLGGVTSASRSGMETRPRNMNIIYIMRVF